MLGCSFKLRNSNFKLPSPLSCRWRSDWLPCHPARTNGGIRDRRSHFRTFPTDQRHGVRLATGNVRTCAMHAAAMVLVPELEAIGSPPFNARSARTQFIRIEQHAIVRVRRTINITRRVLISPEETNSLRSLWLTGDQSCHLDGWPQAMAIVDVS